MCACVRAHRSVQIRKRKFKQSDFNFHCRIRSKVSEDKFMLNDSDVSRQVAFLLLNNRNKILFRSKCFLLEFKS